MKYKGFTYTPTPKTAWDNLSMQEKSEMMKVAVRNGITDLKTIRERYNEFAEDGDTKDSWTMQDEANYRQWRDALPDNLRNTNDNDYDMRAAFKAGMQPVLESDGYYHLGSRDPKTGRILKAPHHPTFLQALATDASMGYYPITDNKGQTYTQTWKGNAFAEGGHKIHIKPENRGKFTALKERTGHSASWFKEHGTPAQKKMAIFALNSRHWKHGLGGNLFDGISEDTQQMQIGRPFWQSQAQEPTFMESLAEFNKQQELKRQQQRKALMKKINTVGRKLAEESMREASVESNDNVWVETPLFNRKKNPHLSRRAEEGAKAHAAWEKEHPNLATWGNLAGAVPFAVAAVPLGAGLVAGGDALATTTIGQAVTSGLAPLYQAATGATIADAPALAWADAGLTSALGAHGIQKAIEDGGISPMTALMLTPVLQITKPMAEGAVTAAKTAYDNGTLWDAYTTFGGRFGNYGDNIFTNMYGTAARRVGLPDKARIPADAIRKLEGRPNVENGIIDLTGEKAFLGNSHTNMTLDQPVVSHPKWVGDGADTYLFPTKNVVGNTGESLKSIEPSDMFVNGVKVMENPKNVTLISGDIDALNWAKENGLQTVSSPKLRKMYAEAVAKYENDLKAYNKLSLLEKTNQKPPIHPKEVSRRQLYWPEYATEVQRLQSRRGTPTLADFKLLEKQTGLNSGVAPISELQTTIEQFHSLPVDKDGVIKPIIYPNGRIVDISGKSARDTEFKLIKRAKYNNIFYDPASMVEYNWQIANGLQ